MIFKMSRILIFLFITVLFSCTKKYQSRVTHEYDVSKDVLIEANRTIIQNEENKIDSILVHSTTIFIKDSSGIRLFIEPNNHTFDTKPKDGDNVLIAYNCVLFEDHSLINDDILIDTISFQIGYSKQMRGLNYAIKRMKTGDKAKIVIPSYLGFGMSGYGKTVPPYSTLLLNVQLLKIKE